MTLDTLPRATVQPTPRQRRWRAPLIGVFILALGAGGAWLVAQSQSRAGAGAQAKAAPAKESKGVDVYELARGDVAPIEARALAISLPLSGSLMPLNQATVKSKVSGQVLEAAVQEGMAVAAGQVLARLDQADHAARVAQQQAALDEASARLSMAVKNDANSAALLKQKYISQNSHDTTQNSVALAQASVNAAKAQLDMARIALADTVIRAPLAGVVSKRHVQAGEKLAPDMPVYSIVNLQQLTLEAQVPASDIPRVKIGQAVQFRVDGYAGRAFSGKVARINPTAEPGSRAMIVYISVDNADSALRGGMFAKGSITTLKSAVMPILPIAALRKGRESGKDSAGKDSAGKDGAGKEIDVVYTIEDGKVVSQPVTLGLRNDDEGTAEVTAGLAAGANVLLGKLEGVKPGSKVKIAGQGAAPATAVAETEPQRGAVVQPLPAKG